MLSLLFIVGLALLNDVRASDVNYDCSTLLPVGKTPKDACPGNIPKLRVFIGNAMQGALLYTRGKEFPCIIRYDGGVVTSLFLTMTSPGSTVPLGTWSVSSGAAVNSACGNGANNALISGNLGTTGIIRAVWTPPATLTGAVEVRIVASDVTGCFRVLPSPLIELDTTAV